MKYSYRTIMWTLSALCFTGVAIALGLQEVYQLEPCRNLKSIQTYSA